MAERAGQECSAKRSEVRYHDELVKVVNKDIERLTEFMEHDSVTDERGVVHDTRLETAFVDVVGSETTQRPVVRLQEEGDGYETVFTRIDARQPATSMVIRVRAGWDKLKAELIGTAEQRKWDTFVCTAAEKPYALEVRFLPALSQLRSKLDRSSSTMFDGTLAPLPHSRGLSGRGLTRYAWRHLQVLRLLDPANELFKRETLKNHLVCVGRDAKKSLRAALHHPIDGNSYKRASPEPRTELPAGEDSTVRPLPRCCLGARATLAEVQLGHLVRVCRAWRRCTRCQSRSSSTTARTCGAAIMSNRLYAPNSSTTMRRSLAPSAPVARR